MSAPLQESCPGVRLVRFRGPMVLPNGRVGGGGGTPFSSIDPLAVHEWQAGLVAAGLSPSRIRNAAQVLGQILDAAVAGGPAARKPAQDLRRPRIVEREMTFLSAAELGALASEIADPYGVLVRFLGWTGLRIGEAAALRVGRLDLLARRVEVVEAATEVNGRVAWGPTKTGERRIVPLPHFLAEQLRAYLADRPHGPDALVFGMPQGGPLRASKWGERYFRPAVAAAGLPEDLRVHDLRHIAASLAIRANASVKIVQAMLGHRSATQTLDRYGDLYPSDLDALAERLDQAHAAATAGEVWPRVARPSSSYAKGRSMTCLVVEVGRLELPSRGVVPGILRAQPPVELRTRAVRWRRSRVLAS